MKRILTILGAVIIASFILTGCENKASEYDNLVKEYKQVLCIVKDSNAPPEDRTKALQRTVDLVEQFQKALLNLPEKEQLKLIAAWDSVANDVSEGKCD